VLALGRSIEYATAAGTRFAKAEGHVSIPLAGQSFRGRQDNILNTVGVIRSVKLHKWSEFARDQEWPCRRWSKGSRSAKCLGALGQRAEFGFRSYMLSVNIIAASKADDETA